jgi:hypothetical protein
MNAFQILGLALCGFFAVGVLVSTVRHRMSGRIGAAWLLLWVSAGAAIARPELTVRVARVLGIARGADLVFYLAILAMFVGFFAVYAKFRRLEGDLTALVRQLALREASGEASAEEPPGRERSVGHERSAGHGQPTGDERPGDDAPVRNGPDEGA